MKTNQEPNKILASQWGLAALILAFTAGGLLYKWLRHEQLGHSAAMFLGLPAVLAILLALAPKARTATGGILKGLTLALLLLAPLLGEGYVCILMASPLFYLVGIIVGLVFDYYRRKHDATVSCLVVLLLPMCLEGVIPQLTRDRSQSVETTRIVPAPVDAVEHALAQSLRVNTALPKFSRIGFPRPLAAWGRGLAIGDTRTVHFSGAEGDPPGDLVLRVTEHRTGYVCFSTVSDGSKLAQWVRWQSSEVEWRALDDGRTLVTWRIHFERQLDPAWYFTPWERAAVQDAAAYLIDANMTPAGRT